MSTKTHCGCVLRFSGSDMAATNIEIDRTNCQWSEPQEPHRAIHRTYETHYHTADCQFDPMAPRGEGWSCGEKDADGRTSDQGGEVIGNVCRAALKLDGPHEPVMFNEKSFLWCIEPGYVANNLKLKVCKHCGSVYAEEIQGE